MEFGFNQHLAFRLDPALSLFTSVHRKVLRLPGSIIAQTLAAFQLPTEGRFVYSDKFGDLHWLMTHYLQRINLVSLFPGKLCAGSDECSPTGMGQAFDLAVREALILPQLPSISAFKAAPGN
jgi:hypothetical protein